MKHPSRRTFLASTAGLAAAGVLSGVASAEGGSYETKDLRIESWDGTELDATLFVPDEDGPFPAILGTHGWGGDRNGAAQQRKADLYASNGYVVLLYDSRGFGDSDGQVGTDGPKEVNDARHLISWLSDHEEVLTDGPDNPRIGMDGLSYAGGIQLNTAAVDDRLDAIVPRWAWHDLTTSLAPNGVVKRNWASLLYAVGVTGSAGLTSGDDGPDEGSATAMTPRLHEIYTESAARNEFADRHEAYYKTRSPASKLDDLGENAPPALFISGFNDTLFTPNEAVDNYDALRERGVDSRLVLFEGAHTLFGELPDEEKQATLDEFALAWMDGHLKNGPPAKLPPVTYYDAQSETFETAESLADPNRELELAGTDGQRAGDDEQTLVANSVEATSTSQLSPENRDFAPGATAAEFVFDIEADVELLGTPELEIPVQPVGGETRLFAKLYHVQNGEETLIDDQVAPFRVDGVERQTVTHDLVTLQRRLEAGDRLKLVIATSDTGFFGSRESTGARLFHSEATLTLPVLEGGSGNSGHTAKIGR